MDDEQFRYAEQQQIKLNKLVGGLIANSKQSSPYFPPQWSKLIAEEYGVESQEDIFFKLMSNIVDYKLDECVKYIKEGSANNQNLNVNTVGNKKQSKDLVLKTLAVESYFVNKDPSVLRPRIYPQFQVNNNQSDTLIPKPEMQEQQPQQNN